MPSENTANCSSAPPENRFSRPRVACSPTSAWIASVSTPGTGMMRAEPVEAMIASVKSILRRSSGTRNALAIAVDHSVSTVPPAASILAVAGPETLSTLTVSFLVSSPSPSTLTGAVVFLTMPLRQQRVDVDRVAVGEERVSRRETLTTAYSTRYAVLEAGKLGQAHVERVLPTLEAGALAAAGARELAVVAAAGACRPGRDHGRGRRACGPCGTRVPGTDRGSASVRSPSSALRRCLGTAAGRSPPADCTTYASCDTKALRSRASVECLLELLDLHEVLDLEDHPADGRCVVLLDGVVDALETERADRAPSGPRESRSRSYLRDSEPLDGGLLRHLLTPPSRRSRPRSCRAAGRRPRRSKSDFRPWAAALSMFSALSVPKRLGEHVGDARELEQRAHRTAGDDAGTGRGRLEQHPARAEHADDLVRDRRR